MTTINDIYVKPIHKQYISLLLKQLVVVLIIKCAEDSVLRHNAFPQVLEYRCCCCCCCCYLCPSHVSSEHLISPACPMCNQHRGLTNLDHTSTINAMGLFYGRRFVDVWKT